MKKLFFLITALFFTYNVFAADYIWTGSAGDHLWSTPGNWSIGFGYPNNSNNRAWFSGAGGSVIIDVAITNLGEMRVFAASNPSITQNFAGTLSLSTGSGYSGSIIMANGSFTQSRTVSVGGALTISGGSYTQNNTLTITGTFSVSSGTFTQNQTITANSAFTITGGSYNNNGALTVNGTTNFNYSGGTLSFTNNGNDFSGAGGVDVQNLAYLTIVDNSTLRFLRINITDPGPATGDLTITAGTTGGAWNITFDNTMGGTSIEGDLTATNQNGFVTNTGGTTVTVGGNAHFTASSYISMDGLNVNAAGTIELDSGTYATITNSGTANLTASTIGTNLDVTSTNGGITDVNQLNVNGASTFRINAAGQDVLLNNAANRFAGALTFSPNPGPIRNIDIYDTTAIALPAIDITGYLDARTTGAASDITNSGSVLVDLTGTFQVNTAGADITLGDAVNILNVGGDITLVTAGGNADIRNAQHIQFNNASISGSLTARADGGDITDNSAVNVTANSSFTVAGGQNIYLDNNGNYFGNTLAFACLPAGSINNITVYDTSDMALPAINITGNLIARTYGAGPNFHISNTGNVVAAGAGDFRTSGTTSNITLGGASTLDIGGDITVVTANGAASVTNAQNINFINTTVAGTLTASATTGDITDANSLTVIGASGSFTCSAANANITLDNLNTSGSNPAINASVSGAGDIVLTASNTLDLGTVTTASGLTATALNGALTDSGNVTLTGNGAARFTASTSNTTINLGTLYISGTGTIEIDTSGATGAAVIVNAYGVRFTGTTVGGDLTATAATGNISAVVNAVAVGGNAHFTALNANDDIDFSIAPGTLQVVGTLELDTSGATGDAAVTNNQNIDFTNTTVTGTLTAVATAGAITDADALTIGAAGSFTCSAAGNAVTLNDLVTPIASPPTISAVVSGAADVTLQATNSIDLNTITVAANRNIFVTALGNGDITDNGAGVLTVPGTGVATFTAAGDAVSLTSAGSVIPNVTVSSDSVLSLTCSSTINLTTAAAPNNPAGLTVNVGGAGCVLASALDLNGDLRINGGTFDVGADRQINITGDWNRAAGAFQPQNGTVIFDGPSGTLSSNETFQNLTIQGASSSTLDVQGHQLTVNASFEIENGAILYRTGLTGESAPTDTNSGRVCYRGAGGTVQFYAGSDYWNLEIAGPGTFTLGGDIDIDNDLYLTNGTLDAGTSPSYQLNIGHDWNNTGGSFTCRTGEVVFDGAGDNTLLGSNTFYNFTSSTAAKNIFFASGSTTTIAAGGTFYVHGVNPAPTWMHLRSTVAGAQWRITVVPGALVDMQYVFVHDSFAVNTIVVSVDVDVTDNCTNWRHDLPVLGMYSEDSDGNGKIERIRVVAAAALNDDFSGLEVHLDNVYTIDTTQGDRGFITGTGGQYDDTFYICLREKTHLDTGSTPQVNIDANSTLTNNGVPARNLQTGSWTPIDLAVPIIGYTVARADTLQVYVQLSEPVADAGGGAVGPGNFLYGGAVQPTTAGLIGTREYLLTYPAGTFTLGDIANGTTVTYQSIVDRAAAPNQLQGAPATVRRLSDFVLTFTGHEPITFQPFFDSTPREPGPEGIGYITRFDGSEWMENQTGIIDLQCAATVGTIDDLVWDSLPSVRFQYLPMWYFTPAAVTALGLGPVYGLTNTFQPLGAGAVGQAETIPGGGTYPIDFSHPELADDTLFTFFIRFSSAAPNLLGTRLADPNSADWYRSVRPFAFGCHHPGGQQGGVEIYNNVINPNHGERTKIRYTLPRDGNVTIQVFSLSGDLVGVLYRGWLIAGQHSTTWAGRNDGGRIVSRGLYFIKVVGPGIDETRKVLVVK